MQQIKDSVMSLKKPIQVVDKLEFANHQLNTIVNFGDEYTEMSPMTNRA